MNKRLIINDCKSNKLATAATCIFMAVSAMLLGLSILLFASLCDSIDSLMATAQTPDFLQMHTGEIDRAKLGDFADRQNYVEKMQVCTFLNLENGQIEIGDRSLTDNTQDNGLSCQSESFDFLLDADNNVIRPAAGEIYLPVCYRSEYDAKAGEAVRIGSDELTIAGFLRDSQMNSMMASSKRFLVSETDFFMKKMIA